MFKVVEFNTLNKMMRCFAGLNKDPQRCAHTFYFTAPEGWARATRYWVYYLPRK